MEELLLLVGTRCLFETATYMLILEYILFIISCVIRKCINCCNRSNENASNGDDYLGLWLWRNYFRILFIFIMMTSFTMIFILIISSILLLRA